MALAPPPRSAAGSSGGEARSLRRLSHALGCRGISSAAESCEPAGTGPELRDPQREEAGGPQPLASGSRAAPSHTLSLVCGCSGGYSQRCTGPRSWRCSGAIRGADAPALPVRSSVFPLDSHGAGAFCSTRGNRGTRLLGGVSVCTGWVGPASALPPRPLLRLRCHLGASHSSDGRSVRAQVAWGMWTSLRMLTCGVDLRRVAWDGPAHAQMPVRAGLRVPRCL